MHRVILLALTIATSLLCACDDDDDDGALDAGTDATAGRGGGSDAGRNTPDASPIDGGTYDAGSRAEMCERAELAFETFVNAHLACSNDDDCEVIGDCGPNADFTAIRKDAAEEGRGLQLARCAGAYDGPIYEPTCRDGRCNKRQVPATTSRGCPPRWVDDGGIDAGQ